MSIEGNKWYVYKAAIVAAVGGLLFGYDTAVVAGAIGFIQLIPETKGKSLEEIELFWLPQNDDEKVSRV